MKKQLLSSQYLLPLLVFNFLFTFLSLSSIFAQCPTTSYSLSCTNSTEVVCVGKAAEGNTNTTIPTLTNADSVLLEVVYQYRNQDTNEDPPDSEFINVDGKRIELCRVPIRAGDKDTDHAIYRTMVPFKPMNDLVYQTNNTVLVRSFKAYFFRPRLNKPRQQRIQYVGRAGWRNKIPGVNNPVIRVPIQGIQNGFTNSNRDITLRLPFSGIAFDGRRYEVIAQPVDANNNPVGNPLSQDAANNNGSDGYDLVRFDFVNLPPSAIFIEISVDSEDKRNVGGKDGQSWVLGSVMIDTQCTDCIDPRPQDDFLEIECDYGRTRLDLRDNDNLDGINKQYSLRPIGTVVEGLDFRTSGIIFYTPRPNEGCYRDTFTYRVCIRNYTRGTCCQNARVFITVMNSDEPKLEGVPKDTTVKNQRLAPLPPVVTGNGCFNSERVFPETDRDRSDPCKHILKRTWTWTDKCNNTVKDSQIVTLLFDSIPPMLTPPNDTVVDCVAPPQVTLVADDNCSGMFGVTPEQDSVVGEKCPRVIYRRWIAIDACNNRRRVVQKITVNDTEPPTFSSPPADTTVDCKPPEKVQLIATDNCKGDFAVNPTDSQNGKIITRVWEAVDDCNNVTRDTQLITLLDDEDPVINGVPEDMTVDCNVPAKVTLTVTDNCLEDFSVESKDSILSRKGLHCMEIMRTWMAEDACGNLKRDTQMITVEDNQAPVFTETPQDITVTCQPPAKTTLTANDNCLGAVSVSCTDDTDPNNPKLIVRTWTAVDSCMNVATVSQRITVIDEDPPTFSEIPQDMTVDCEAPAKVTLTATDNCLGTVQVECTDNIISRKGEHCYVVERTWTAKDFCNEVTITQTITVEDNVPPTIVSPPADTMVECVAMLPTTLTAIDNCDDEVEVFFRETESEGKCPKVITRQWIARDECMNETRAIQRIIVNDTIKPMLSVKPLNITYYCEAEDPVTVTATDNCGGSVEVKFELDSTGICPIIYTRKWTAVDECGNVCMHTQIVTVIDTIAPVFSEEPENMIVECEEAPTEVTATDDCDKKVAVFFTETKLGICPYTITRTWTATDNCGNENKHVQKITVTECELPESCPLEGLFDSRVWIESVELEGINMSSGKNSGYKDYTHLSTTLRKGEVYLISIQPGLKDPIDYYGKVWLDLNKDGDFEDTGEELLAFSNEAILSFSIPASAATGLMRMRIALSDKSDIDPCGTFKYGEVEDYSIKVLGETQLGSNQTPASFKNLKITTTTSVSDAVRLFPNPAKDKLTVAFKKVPKANSQLSIYNSKGQVVYQEKVTDIKDNQIQISLEQFQPGIYFLGINANGEEQIIEKFTKL